MSEVQVGEHEQNVPSSIEQITEDYFGTDDVRRFYMPDGKQYIEYKVFAEGERVLYQNKSNRDIRIDRATNSAHLKLEPGSERMILLEIACVGWNLQRRNSGGGMESVAFSKGSPGTTFSQWLVKAPVGIIDALEKDIRKANPWLLGEMKSEDILKEIKSLEEMYETAVKREQGEGASSSR